MLGEEQILHERYHIQRQLGHNAGRRTLLAQDLHTQEFAVLKILSFNSDFRWEDLKLFEREAETLKSLSHPAIPCYLDSFELDLPDCRGFVLVQTYIDATSLQEWIKRGRTFSEEEVKQIAKALLKVLSYLHERNPPVIHRDIKPSNSSNPTKTLWQQNFSSQGYGNSRNRFTSRTFGWIIWSIGLFISRFRLFYSNFTELVIVFSSY